MYTTSDIKRVRYHSIQLYDMARWHMRYELECEQMEQWNNICSRSVLESSSRD